MKKHTLSAHGSIRLNRRIGGKFPHLTVCAEAWILDYRVRIFCLDLLVLLIFRERHHCRNQYLTYGTKKMTKEPYRLRTLKSDLADLKNPAILRKYPHFTKNLDERIAELEAAIKDMETLHE
jgi:hypothetical protein